MIYLKTNNRWVLFLHSPSLVSFLNEKPKKHIVTLCIKVKCHFCATSSVINKLLFINTLYFYTFSFNFNFSNCMLHLSFVLHIIEIFLYSFNINTYFISVSCLDQRFSIPVLAPPRSAHFLCYSYRFRCLFYSIVSALRSGHHRIFLHDSSSKRTYIFHSKCIEVCEMWI